MLQSLRAQIRRAILPIGPSDLNLDLIPPGALTFPDDIPPVLAILGGVDSKTGHLVAVDALGRLQIVNPVLAFTTTGQLQVSVYDSAGNPILAGVSGDALTAGNVAATGSLLFNGVSWDRPREWGTGGSALGVAMVSPPSTTAQTVTGAAAAVASIVLPAVAGQRNRLLLLEAHYSAAQAGTLTVADGAATVLSVPISGSALQAIVLPTGGVGGTAGNAMTVSLTAGGVGITGTINLASLTG